MKNSLYKISFIYLFYIIGIFFIINILLYLFIEHSIFTNIKNNIKNESKYFQKEYFSKIQNSNFYQITPYIKLEILIFEKELQIGFDETQEKIISYTYPLLDKNLYLKITQNIEDEKKFMNHLIIIFILIWTIFSFLYLILRYLSNKKLLVSIDTLIYKITNMDDDISKYNEIKNLPYEFNDLIKSINMFLKKIKTSIQYREQLYIGTSHELKTPLSIMKLKTQITLMKIKNKDSFDKNIVLEALEQNLISIDNLNHIIINILEYGRAESAQFEKPRRINLLNLIIEKSEEYELLANSKNKNLNCHIEVESFNVKIQPVLFIQIFQNLIANSLKFIKENGTISIHVYITSENFIIDILDESDGIDEKLDLFAPFIKSPKSKGTGLGLFLAKNAAESMGVTLSLKNRINHIGTISTIKFPLQDFLF